MFAFACSTHKHLLIDTLSQFIVVQFDIFSKVDKFLEIPIEDLKIILERWALLSVGDEELVLSAIIRWIYHNREQRLQYFEELIRKISFENISAAYMRFLCTKFVVDTDITSLTKVIKPVGYDEVSKLPKNPFSTIDKSLYVYVKYGNENLTRIVSIDGNLDCAFRHEISPSDLHHSIRAVALNDSYLFCLDYFRRNPRKQLASNQYQTFSAFTSVDLCAKLHLKPPPIIFKEVGSMCALRGNIFVYNEAIFSKIIRTDVPNSTTFNDEEIRRGIYMYNCEVDDWFPVPMMLNQLKNSCMCACDDTLYLIGGQALDKSHPMSYAQAYDYRSGKWRKLTSTKHQYSGAACCSIGNKIYVCGGIFEEGKAIEWYDPVLGEWDSPYRDLMPKGMTYHRAVNYLNQLWLMGSYDFENGRPINDLTIEIHEPEAGYYSNQWKSLTIPVEAVESTINSGFIIDGVVFKS